MGLQALLALMQLIRHGRLQYAQLGVDSLLLTTNNTGKGGSCISVRRKQHLLYMSQGLQNIDCTYGAACFCTLQAACRLWSC
jgi:hypothetical protein